MSETDDRELLSEAHISFLKHQIKRDEVRAELVLGEWCESRETSSVAKA